MFYTTLEIKMYMTRSKNIFFKLILFRHALFLFIKKSIIHKRKTILLCAAPPKASLLYFNHNVNDDNFRNFVKKKIVFLLCIIDFLMNRNKACRNKISLKKIFLDRVIYILISNVV
jgi:hypothetical protein